MLSFAYPYAEYNATVQSIVRDCGYTSARTVGGIRSGSVCGGCPLAETIPPLDAYATQTPEDISSQTSLAAMQSYVTQAESGGGWVQFVFHGIGDRGGFPLSQFTAFLDWLQPRAANGTVVRTVYEAMSGAPPPPPGVDTFPPSTTIACNGGPCSGWYPPPVTITLTATDNGGVSATRYTTDGTEPTESSLAYAGPFGVSTTTTLRYRSWDTAGNVEATKTQAIQVDSTGPAVGITQPAAGSTITGPRTTIVANASDPQSGIRQVVFLVDGVSIGSASSSPYQVTWRISKKAAGPHQLTAIATNGAGMSTTSNPVTTTIG